MNEIEEIGDYNNLYHELVEEGSEMAGGYEEQNNDLNECCALDCNRPGTELLIMKSWIGSKYGGDESQTNHPVIGGYYCRNHMADKLESLTRRYRSSSSNSGNGAGSTAPDVNLIATTPRHE